MNAGWAPYSRGRCSFIENKASSVSQVWIFSEKGKSRWGCGDKSFLFINDLVRQSSCHIMNPLGNHLNRRLLSQEIQDYISLSQSTLYLAYWENLYSSWYFYVDVPSHGSHVYLRLPNFERILYAETCQQQTISPKSIPASSCVRWISLCLQAAQIWSISNHRDINHGQAARVVFSDGS